MSNETIVNINDRAAQSLTSFPLLTTPVIVYDKEDIYSMVEGQVIPVSLTTSGIGITKVIRQNGVFPEGMDTERYTISETVVNITGVGHGHTSYPNTTVFVSITGDLETGQLTATHRVEGIVTNDSKIIVLNSTTNELVTTKDVVAGHYEIDIPSQEVDVCAKLIDGQMLAQGEITPLEI